MQAIVTKYIGPTDTKGARITEDVKAPEGFKVVTKDEFFAALTADPRDIMPCINHSPYYTTWETKSRAVWGWTSPGWKNAGADKIYALAP